MEGCCRQLICQEFDCLRMRHCHEHIIQSWYTIFNDSLEQQGSWSSLSQAPPHQRWTFSFLNLFLCKVLNPADISFSSSSIVNDSSLSFSMKRYVGGLSTLTCLLNFLCEPESAKRFILQMQWSSGWVMPWAVIALLQIKTQSQCLEVLSQISVTQWV